MASSDKLQDLIEKDGFHKSLLYMDDLKLYAKSDIELNKQLEIVSRFSKDICMEFGLDKCNKVTIKKGKQATTGEINIDDVAIKELEAENIYKYLGVEENATIEHQRMREKLREEYLLRVNKIMKTKLSTKNKIKTIKLLTNSPSPFYNIVLDW